MMEYLLVLLAAICLLILLRFQLKYRKPLYQYRCDYSYSHFGSHGQYFTEILKAKQTISEETATNVNTNDNHNHQSFEEKTNFNSIEDPTQLPQTERKKLVFLFFSGNPGYIRFYDRFLQHLSNVYGGMYEVLGVGQAGQSLHESEFHKIFTLNEQLEHKVLFFNALISREEYADAKFILIGHSFGCYAAMKLLAKVGKSRIHHFLMIHPVIQRIGDTPNGKKGRVLQGYSRLHKFILRVVDSFFPIAVLRAIALRHFEAERYPNGEDITDISETLALWLRYDTAYSFIKLSLHQFEEIRELSYTEIGEVADKLTLFYGQNDDWTPQDHRDDFKDQFGHTARCVEDKLGMTHTFVAGGSLAMAQTVKEILQGII